MDLSSKSRATGRRELTFFAINELIKVFDADNDGERECV
jgi:hypothetical protein